MITTLLVNILNVHVCAVHVYVAGQNEIQVKMILT